ncbi:hypothetical protein GCM10017608_10340 [Agromyces luteolus]|uniref:LppX_LprAFG lipoprotein n=1 Tax=Agromyces luteolus TaxID=88373 RepID=A0A7C9HJD8_9MICO|nr:hypothetical protein [Agromyces luteolus]MUN08566.1 hypothetical protein [Agromyces luteolus]GLK27101.1 hypothetical protein GCM10017608_10340 [Agromyces luteolus]
MRARKVHRIATIAAVTAVAAAATGCSAGSVDAGAGSGAGGSASSGLPVGDQPVDLDPARFSPDIDNPYWPMTPGTRWTYREAGADGTDLVVTVIATSQTKRIANGITARVVRDTVRDGADIIEDTFDWYAQDDAGAVWYLGEETAEFEDGAITSRSGSFEAGVDGALPGILIPADPQPGMAYRQEYYRGEAEDNGEVLSVHAKAEAPIGAFDDVLLTWDTITIEPDVAELKFYAPGVGPVLALDASGGAGREELVRIDTVPDGAGTGPLGSPD